MTIRMKAMKFTETIKRSNNELCAKVNLCICVDCNTHTEVERKQQKKIGKLNNMQNKYKFKFNCTLGHLPLSHFPNVPRTVDSCIRHSAVRNFGN